MKKIYQFYLKKYLIFIVSVTTCVLFGRINSTAQCNCINASTFNPCIGTAYTLTAGIDPFDFIAISGNWQVTSSSASYTLSPSPPFDYRYAYLTLHSAGTVSIRVRYAFQGDENDIRFTSTRTFTALQATISGPAHVCKNSSYNYSVSFPFTPTNYTYTFPSGCTVNGNNSPYTTTSASINLAVGVSASSGNVCVTVNGTGCSTVNSPCQSIAVSAGIPVQPGVITAIVNEEACPTYGWNLSISAVTNATYYTWTENSIYFSIISSGNTAADLLILGGGYSKTTTATVKACSGCGCGSERTKNLTSWTYQQCGPLRLSKNFPQTEINSALIFPNPATEIINVLVAEEKEKRLVQIFNTLGEIVFDNSFETGLIEINIENLRGGIYFLKVSDSTNSQTEKIIIQR